MNILSLLNRQQLICGRCGKVGGYPAMVRWHVKRKCKGKKNPHGGPTGRGGA